MAVKLMPQSQGWTREVIAAGMARPRYNAGATMHDPMPWLQKQKGFWMGAIFTRKQFAEQDRSRATRFLETSHVSSTADQTDAQLTARFGDQMLIRDVAFAAVAASEKCHLIADQHEKAIERYQRRLSALDQ